MALEITHRHLPHWALEGSTYFVTWSLIASLPKLSPEERDVVEKSLFFFHKTRYELYSFVIMDDHVHCIFMPLNGWTPNKIISSWKKFTATQFQGKNERRGQIWLEEYYDRIIRNEPDLREKAEYVLTNPKRRWPEVSEYKWVWHVGLGERNGTDGEGTDTEIRPHG